MHRSTLLATLGKSKSLGRNIDLSLQLSKQNIRTLLKFDGEVKRMVQNPRLTFWFSRFAVWHLLSLHHVDSLPVISLSSEFPTLCNLQLVGALQQQALKFVATLKVDWKWHKARNRFWKVKSTNCCSMLILLRKWSKNSRLTFVYKTSLRRMHQSIACTAFLWAFHSRFWVFIIEHLTVNGLEYAY